MDSDLELGRAQRDANLRHDMDMASDDGQGEIQPRRSRSASERFAFSQADGAAESEALGKQAFVRKVVVNGVLIALW